MSAKIPYSVEVRRMADRGRSNGAVLGMAVYSAGLLATIGTPASFFGASLVLNGAVLFGGLLVAGVVGAVAGKVIAGTWNAVVKSPGLTNQELPMVASEDVGMTHKVQLSQAPEHVAYVHEGRVVESDKGAIKDIHTYQDYIDESRAAQAELSENGRS